MPETKIIVAEISEKNGWLNIKTNEGKEISVKMDKAVKVAAQLKDAKPGSEATGNLVEKDGKYYMWDLDEKKGGFGGGKGFAPKDKKFDAGVAALNAAASLYSFDKDKNTTVLLQTAEMFHQFLMSKVTAAPAETK